VLDELNLAPSDVLEALNRLLDLADTGIRQLIALQRGLVGQYLQKS